MRKQKAPSPVSKVRLMDKSGAAGCAAKVSPKVLAALLSRLPPDPSAAGRLLSSGHSNEDAAVLTFPQGKALVQTLDFFPPVVNDPYAFGQIAAANALSDVYAMGGEPWCAMNILCFPVRDLPLECLEAILAGGADKLAEAGAAMAGGHSVDDPEVKYGLAVSGFVDPLHFAVNTALKPGHILLLTKALGTGVLATAVKVGWEDAESLEGHIVASASKLSRGAAEVIRRLKVGAATDITGFGLGGHLLEMARASKVDIRLEVQSLPLLPKVLELAGMGLLPAGSHANKSYLLPETSVAANVDPLRVDLVFDAQTSGGIVLALEPEQENEARSILNDFGDMACRIGCVEAEGGGPRLHII